MKAVKPSSARLVKSAPSKALTKVPVKATAAKAPVKAPVKVATKSISKPVVAKKVETKTVAKVAAKPITKTIPKVETKAAVKVETKPVVKVATVKVETTSLAAKPVVKAVVVPKVETRTLKATPPMTNYKSPFPADELGKWKEILLAKRSEISNDIQDLVKDAMDAEDGHTTPNHIAERGSDADLQDMSLGMVGEEKELIWQIDRALRKIDLSMPIPFGLCEFTKQPIAKNRLQIIPWTPLSIEGAAQMEREGATIEDMIIDD